MEHYGWPPARWRPDQRSVGAVLAALFVAEFLAGMVTVDVTIRAFTNAVLSSGVDNPGLQARIALDVTGKLLLLPAQFLVAAGGLGLALRWRGGRPLAVTGMVGVVIADLAIALSLLSGVPDVQWLRLVLLQVLPLVGAVLALCVLLWSRAA